MAGLCLVASRLYAAAGDDVIRETTREIGYLRVSDTISRRRQTALRRAIRENQLIAVDDLIVPVVDKKN